LFIGFGSFFVEVISEFFGLLFIADFKFEFALFSAQDDGLAFHAADHVEGRAWLSAQGHLQEVLLDACLDGLAELTLDLKEAVGRAKTINTLMRALVVVVFNPELDALAGGVKALELSAAEKVLPNSLPEALDFAESHGVLRTGTEVGHAILLELRLKAGGSTPTGVLAPIIRQHLFGWLELGHGLAVNLDDRLGCGAPEKVGPDQEARIVIHEGDEVTVTAAQPEGEDVRLPHLIGSGPFKEAWPGDVLLLGRGLGFQQVGLMELLAHGLRTGLKEEDPPEPLGDGFNSKGRVFLFELNNLFGDNGRDFGLPEFRRRVALKALFTLLLVKLNPPGEGLGAHTRFLRDEGAGEALFEVEFNGFEFELEWEADVLFLWPARSPPRGGVVVVLYWIMITFFGHVTLHLALECQPIICLAWSHELVARTLVQRNDKRSQF
jgi:hypothetical protein